MRPEQKNGGRFWLSTEGYYFEYRPDRNDANLKRATLYEEKTGAIVDDICVSENWGLPAKDHFAVINHFEAKLFLKQQTK